MQTGSGVPTAVTDQTVESQSDRVALAGQLRPYLRGGRIDKEALRDSLQKVTLNLLIDALLQNKPSDIRELTKVLAEISGMKAQKILVEAKAGYTRDEVAAFTQAGKGILAIGEGGQKHSDGD